MIFFRKNWWAFTTFIGLFAFKVILKKFVRAIWYKIIGITRICVHIFSKFLIFEKIRTRGFMGSGITNLTSILPYEVSVPRYTTKMSTFPNIDFMHFICILNQILLLLSYFDKYMALRDPGMLEFARLVNTEELAIESNWRHLKTKIFRQMHGTKNDPSLSWHGSF